MANRGRRKAGRTEEAEVDCPSCGQPLEYRGPFDGTEASTGVADGHEGFGATYQCPSGHWFAFLQGKLVGPEHILTVVER